MLEGELRVTKFFGEQEIYFATRVPGEFFGEILILLDVPNFVLYRAVSDSRLFRLPRAGFWDLLFRKERDGRWIRLAFDADLSKRAERATAKVSRPRIGG